MTVTLVIKTPSLKLSDLTYSCDAATTVLQLKTYLENQYPSKPKPEEQRLIYQGRLLRDNEVLQDFLRILDSEQKHTFHLVYMLKRSPSAENQMAVPPEADVLAGAANEGLRLRQNVAHRASPATLAETVQPLQQHPPTPESMINGQFPAASIWASQAGFTDPVAQQLVWWQQVYAQHYWAQYMHQFGQQPHQQLQTVAPSVAEPLGQAQVIRHPPAAAAAAPEPERPQQQEQRRPPMAAVGGVAQDDDDEAGIRAARDWLDWIYLGSRLAILLGVMYYYSSLPRFMLVTLIVAGIYLYQKAIHQRRHIVPPAPQQQQPRPAEVNNNAGHVAAVPEAPMHIPAPEADDPAVAAVHDEPVEPIQGADAAAAAITPTAFNVALNVLIGFFTSLIPEVPAPEALN